MIDSRDCVRPVLALFRNQVLIARPSYKSNHEAFRIERAR